MKSIVLTVLLTFLSIVVSKTETEVFKCASDLKLDTCYLKNVVETDTEKTTTVYLDACSKGKYCVESNSGPMLSQCMKVKYLLKEGDKCISSSECYSGICTNEKCAIIADGSKCSSDKECALGSYAKRATEGFVCTKYAAKDADCSDTECRPGLICSDDKKCIPIYSLANGEKSDTDSACASYNSFSNSGVPQCGEITAVGTCASTASGTADVTIAFATNVTVKCNCDNTSSEDRLGCDNYQNEYRRQAAFIEYSTELKEHIDDILKEDKYLEAYKFGDEHKTFGIKKLREKYIEYSKAEEISQASTDDEKDCVRDYYIRQLSSKTLYINLLGVALFAIALL